MSRIKEETVEGTLKHYLAVVMLIVSMFIGLSIVLRVVNTIDELEKEMAMTATSEEVPPFIGYYLPSDSLKTNKWDISLEKDAVIFRPSEERKATLVDYLASDCNVNYNVIDKREWSALNGKSAYKITTSCYSLFITPSQREYMFTFIQADTIPYTYKKYSYATSVDM